MKNKKIVFCLCCAFLLCLAGCAPAQDSSPEETPSITTPEEYCKEFDGADLIVADDGSFYVEATKVSWVTELDLADGAVIGSVERSGITADFQPWDATLLPAGTEISRHNSEKEVLIAHVEEEAIPYLQYAG